MVRESVESVRSMEFNDLPQSHVTYAYSPSRLENSYTNGSSFEFLFTYNLTWAGPIVYYTVSRILVTARHIAHD